MRTQYLARALLAAMLCTTAGTVLAQDAGNAQSSTPSVQSIIDQLKPSDDSVVDGVHTRSLRLGAAAGAVEAADAPTPAPAPASISMQIQFAFASDRIDGASATTMSNLAAALASDELKGRTFEIVGHTDGVGSADYNMRLSRMRAASVKNYLVSHGVSASRLQTQGKGETDLANPADPAAAENRRVVIVASGG
jgi:outer membrane protein OmpA-like peptidoglycan-associated protein